MPTPNLASNTFSPVRRKAQLLLLPLLLSNQTSEYIRTSKEARFVAYYAKISFAAVMSLAIEEI